MIKKNNSDSLIYTLKMKSCKTSNLEAFLKVKVLFLNLIKQFYLNEPFLSLLEHHLDFN